MNKTIVRRLLVFLLGLLICTGAALAQQSSAGSPLADIFRSNEDELLDPDQAFKLSIAVRDASTVVAQFRPAPGYYLYRERISFVLVDTTDTSIVRVDLPPGEAKNDPLFGETRVFHQPFAALLSMKRADGAASSVKLNATYQGCSEKGICYPPINKTFNLTLVSG
ncbi:MAG: protein-disulfide reductase DsbD N-terminal domain-containing protein, partial [Burkholderiales bacterium]|nr:protein-disulfide reductase DsbD N-terminal domain-containing protein [Burkholderiales bacterium]